MSNVRRHTVQESVRYEEFVADLARVLLRERPSSDVRSGFRNRIAGSSGVPHQIDVSFIDKSTKPHTLVLIECKRLRKPVKLAHVKVLKATIDDLTDRLGGEINVKGYLVSLSGAQRSAIIYAAHYDIELQLVSDETHYEFRYADLQLIARVGKASGQSHAAAHGSALRSCNLCGEPFTGDGIVKVCQSCRVRNERPGG
jgi:hypothetical protein